MFDWMNIGYGLFIVSLVHFKNSLSCIMHSTEQLTYVKLLKPAILQRWKLQWMVSMMRMSSYLSDNDLHVCFWPQNTLRLSYSYFLLVSALMNNLFYYIVHLRKHTWLFLTPTAKWVISNKLFSKLLGNYWIESNGLDYESCYWKMLLMDHCSEVLNVSQFLANCHDVSDNLVLTSRGN